MAKEVPQHMISEQQWLPVSWSVLLPGFRDSALVRSTSSGMLASDSLVFNEQGRSPTPWLWVCPLWQGSWADQRCWKALDRWKQAPQVWLFGTYLKQEQSKHQQKAMRPSAELKSNWRQRFGLLDSLNNKVITRSHLISANHSTHLKCFTYFVCNMYKLILHKSGELGLILIRF